VRLPARHYTGSAKKADAQRAPTCAVGLGGTADQWEPQIEYFKQQPDFQFIVFDNRGMGFSDPVAGRWTTTKMARDTLALLDYHGWKSNVHIVGLSMGGMISQETVRQDPKRFASMTLLSTIAGGPFSLGLFILAIPTGLRLTLQTFTASTGRDQLKNGLKLLYPAAFLDGTSPHPETGEPTSNFKLFRSALIRRGVQAVKDGMPPQRFSSIVKQGFAVMTHNVTTSELQALSKLLGGNTLVVTGDEDILVHPRNANRLTDGLRAELLVLPGAGHGANEQVCYCSISGQLTPCNNNNKKPQYAREVNQAIERKVLIASKL